MPDLWKHIVGIAPITIVTQKGKTEMEYRVQLDYQEIVEARDRHEALEKIADRLVEQIQQITGSDDRVEVLESIGFTLSVGLQR